MENLLRALSSGGPYPRGVLLDEYLSTWFSCLWRLSEITPVSEHGAALVESGRGLTVSVARPGDDSGFDAADQEMLVEGFLGYFHTHPYDSGVTGAAFSASDLRVTINSKMKMGIVQSGDDIFMIVRTQYTPERVAFDEISETEFQSRVALHDPEGLDWPQAVLQTNLQFCREYGLLFYAGNRDRRLERR